MGESVGRVFRKALSGQSGGIIGTRLPRSKRQPVRAGACAKLADDSPALQAPSIPKNQLLASLPEDDYRRLLPSLQPIALHEFQVLYESDGPMHHVYFPERGLISLLTTLADGNSLEIAAVTYRGMLGIHLALGSKVSVHQATVQIDGSALKMGAERFEAEFKRGGIFQNVVLNYVRRRLYMVSQYVACNRIHLLQNRLARLLLTIHDEVGPAEFSMTHERLGGMLGAPRSEVSKLADRFREAGFVDYRRSRIRILNRGGLESASCECYWVVAQEIP